MSGDAVRRFVTARHQAHDQAARNHVQNIADLYSSACDVKLNRDSLIDLLEAAYPGTYEVDLENHTIHVPSAAHRDLLVAYRVKFDRAQRWRSGYQVPLTSGRNLLPKQYPPGRKTFENGAFYHGIYKRAYEIATQRNDLFDSDDSDSDLDFENNY